MRTGFARKLVVVDARVVEPLYEREKEVEGRAVDTDALAATAALALAPPMQKYPITVRIMAKPIVAIISHCSVEGRKAF
ncbi:hypothetical protein [Acinetobacter baumannii]|uniref:hypothetical protein n=1 Tax=Acinetobacter baumannii TaxID=470 RepID=UPI001FF5A34D|nr:hypothetical protein [Acinetobacter baumannii]EKU8856903.1 hypothetical protein [Acinetobacter baumannii]MCJ9301628.1 hypothetical protein [Acinetobacter baumannii]MCJ9319791.1 hypothetical protein [Acinetobacter baumannii]MCJ9346424.1 hypothetical protein [Acinetobacter baumannii]MCJ9356624.1 hypothetical protein [Acinetobacter baumannii]